MVFSGAVESGGRQGGIDGVSRFHAIDGLEAPVPLLANSVTLDGVLDTAEWEGAYGTLSSTGPTSSRRASPSPDRCFLSRNRALAFICFTTETRLYVAVDVIDPLSGFQFRTRFAVECGQCDSRSRRQSKPCARGEK